MNNASLGGINAVSRKFTGNNFVDKSDLDFLIDPETGSNIDVINLRRNVMDAQFMLLVMAGFALFAGAAEADDEEREKRKERLGLRKKPPKSAAERANIFMANMCMSLYSDLSYYSNIMGLNNAVKGIAPVGRLLDDVGKVAMAFIDQFDEKSSKLQSGPFKGQNKLFIRTVETVPFLRVPFSIYKQSERIHTKPQEVILKGSRF